MARLVLITPECCGYQWTGDIPAPYVDHPDVIGKRGATPLEYAISHMLHCDAQEEDVELIRADLSARGYTLITTTYQPACNQDADNAFRESDDIGLYDDGSGVIRDGHGNIVESDE